MKTKFILLLLIAVTNSLQAQTFNSGSDGSYGPLNITSNTTLDLPPNGIFNCTSINIAGGATLRFNKNPLNTPVYLLATSNVGVNGTIDLSASAINGSLPGGGGPGGFDGGYGGSGINNANGSGQGPGGGDTTYANGNPGVFAQPSGANGNVYGNVLNSPLIGGSGGAGFPGNPGLGGGGGGGAILIAANSSITVNGSITVRGSNGGSGGSGGGIRLVAPIVTGTGSLDTSSGGALVYPYLSGSQGRVRIDCTDAYAFRSLAMYGVATRGSQMFVFPAVVPRLDILQAAGQVIPEGTNNGIVVNLPVGASTNQTVIVQARDFTNSVSIRIAVIPENGASVDYDTNIVMSTNPSTVSVPVTINAGVISRISAWTK